MAARNTGPEPRRRPTPGGPIQRFLVWWQRLLTGLLGGSRAGVKSARPSDPEAARSHRGLFALRSPALPWAASVALIIGAVGTVALSSSGQDRSVAISAAVMMIVWAGVRWALMDVVARHRTTLARTDVFSAWAIGSLVWVLGVTPELRLLAWTVSGAVTWLILERLGAIRRQAALCVGVAWGAQALVVIGSWLARNAIIAILATRG